MKEDKKPYVARNGSGVELLVYADGLAIILSKMNKGVKHEFTPRLELRYKNITREYLANTYGKVESKEHAEFISELLTNNGAELCGCFRNTGYFYTFESYGELYFSFCLRDRCANSDGEKLITIPMPPKDVVSGRSKSDPISPLQNINPDGIEKMHLNHTTEKATPNKPQVLFANETGLNLSFKTSFHEHLDGEQVVRVEVIDNGVEVSGQSSPLKFEVVGGLDGSPSNEHSTFTPVSSEGMNDEWPEAGEEVLYNGVLYCYLCKSPFSNSAVITVAGNDEWDVISANYDDLEKPKTPEEELQDELIDIIDNASCSEQAAEYIVKTYLTLNTKKPQ